MTLDIMLVACTDSRHRFQVYDGPVYGSRNDMDPSGRCIFYKPSSIQAVRERNAIHLAMWCRAQRDAEIPMTTGEHSLSALVLCHTRLIDASRSL